MEGKYITFENLDVYKLSRQLSAMSWTIYDGFDWQIKKIVGDQFIRAVDSVGANIAEGYTRFHYLDKIKFYYIARASLTEAIHWVSLMKERSLISSELHSSFIELAKRTEIRLNNFISSTYKAKYPQNST